MGSSFFHRHTKDVRPTHKLTTKHNIWKKKICALDQIDVRPFRVVETHAICRSLTFKMMSNIFKLPLSLSIKTILSQDPRDNENALLYPIFM